jgi:hypothetical protein
MIIWVDATMTPGRPRASGPGDFTAFAINVVGDPTAALAAMETLGRVDGGAHVWVDLDVVRRLAGGTPRAPLGRTRLT